MINSYIRSIGNLDSILYDAKMLTEAVNIYKEQPGQYFSAAFNYSDKVFEKFTIQRGEHRVGEAIRTFKNSWQPEFLERILKENKKKKYFRSADTFRFFFKYNGVRLELIDVWNDKNGYIMPEDYNEFFCTPDNIESSKLVGIKKLNKKYIDTHRGYIIRRVDGRKVML